MLKFKVRTYDQSLLAQAAAELQDKALAIFRPDLVVGIATGGEMLAGLMFGDVRHVSIACRRPTTRKKSHPAMRRIAKILPYWVLDRLRMAEARMLGRKMEKKPGGEKTAHVEADAARAISSAKSILIVDDAVDSGLTLKAVEQAVRKLAPGARVATAAITVTMPNPVAMPDCYLHNDRTLARFPWSLDFKK